MVDTIRPLADLQALLADNTTADISPQDVRDFLVTAVPSGRSVNFVVASSTATDKQKYDADYVCDGTADEIQINLAINALPASGGTVVLTEGTFTLASVIIPLDKTRLRGQGINQTVLVIGNTSGGRAIATTDGADDLYFADFKVDGNNGTGNGIYLLHNDRTVVERVWLDDVGGRGIWFVDGFNDRISNVRITNHGKTTSTNGEQAAIVIQITQGMVVENCYISTTTGYGIWVSTTGGSPQELTIRGNKIYNCGWIGIGADSESGQTIIDGNFIDTCFGNCIDTGTGDKIIISNNFLKDGNQGIDTDGGGEVQIINNTVVNTVANVGGANWQGIVMTPNQQGAQRTKMICIGNTVTGAVDDGIELEGYDGAIIANNICNNNAGRGIDINDFNGWGTKNLIISGNICQANTGPGIEVTADGNSTTNVRITGNIVEGNGSAQISAAAGTSTVRGNWGYVTEASGTGSLASGTTADVITHGLAVTPTIDDITITLGENPTNTPGAIWVDTIGATTFTVNCENDPGASNLDFGWRAEVL